MTSMGVDEAPELAKAVVPTAAYAGTYEEHKAGRGSIDVTNIPSASSDDGSDLGVTEEDLKTLRRVPGKIPWSAYTIAFVELCERFSYYGTTVVFVNFIQRPLPEGSTTGALVTPEQNQPGALGLGQRTSTGLVMFNQFWAYLMPLAGAYVADARLGRFKTIHIAIAIAIVGHVILTASAAPKVIAHPTGSITAFSIGLIAMGVGTGFFKSNISPLLAEQVPETRMHVRTEANGERVLVDPAVTNSRIFLYFYLCINIGSLVGQISMVYAEQRVGFWLSYMLPTILFLMAPIVLAVCKKNYVLNPPTGSVMAKFFQMWTYAMKGNWSLNLAKMKRNFNWDVVRPSLVPVAQRPDWMTYDDAWVDEVRRGLKACKVFLFLPLYWLAYSQMTGNLTSQAGTMVLNGVPNDLIQNLNPISIIIMIPIMDRIVYPALRRAHINFTPLKRMCTGFFLASLAMVAACVIQYYIYQKSPCGSSANTCYVDGASSGTVDPAPINVWVQAVPYVFIGLSEIFTSITGLEYAFSKAPANMRSLVMAVNLLMNAFSSAIAQALVSLSEDPLLVWNYGVVAVLAAIGGTLFWICFAKLDRDEDKWNMIETSRYRGKGSGTNVAEPSIEEQRAAEKV